MDRATAILIQAHALRALDAVFEAAREAHGLLAAPEFDSVGRALAGANDALDLGVLELVHQLHPDLRERDGGAYPPMPASPEPERREG